MAKVNPAWPSGLFARGQTGSLARFSDPGRAEGRLRFTGGGKSELRRARCRVTRLQGGMHAGGGTSKCRRRPVPQKTNRPVRRVRVKRWGKSPPPQEQSRGHGKPHWEQDQIGSPGRPVPLRLRVGSQQINGPLRSRLAGQRRQNSAYSPTGIGDIFIVPPRGFARFYAFDTRQTLT